MSQAKKDNFTRNETGERGRSNKPNNDDSELVEKLVGINRVAKVVKGGRRFGFAALVVVGNGRGRVGFGTGKAREVPEAIRKAGQSAREKMINVPLREGRTLHYDVVGKYGAGSVTMRAAPSGTGVIAGGPTRAVFETLGISDIVAKSTGSNNHYNMIRAAFNGLQQCQSPSHLAQRRGLKMSEIISRRGGKQSSSKGTKDNG